MDTSTDKVIAGKAEYNERRDSFSRFIHLIGNIMNERVFLVSLSLLGACGKISINGHSASNISSVDTEKSLGIPYQEPEVAVISMAREKAKKEGKMLVVKMGSPLGSNEFEFEFQSNVHGVRDRIEKIAVVVTVYNFFQYLGYSMNEKVLRNNGWSPSFVLENPTTGKISLVAGYDRARLLSKLDQFRKNDSLMSGTLAELKAVIAAQQVAAYQLVADLQNELSFEGSAQQIIDVNSWIVDAVESNPVSFPKDRIFEGGKWLVNDVIKVDSIEGKFEDLVSNGFYNAKELSLLFPGEFRALRDGSLNPFSKGYVQARLNDLYFTYEVSSEIRRSGYLSAAIKCEGIAEDAKSGESYIPLVVPADAPLEVKVEIKKINELNEDKKTNSPAQNIELCYALKAMTGMFDKTEIDRVLALPEPPTDEYGGSSRYKRALLAFSGSFEKLVSSIESRKMENLKMGTQIVEEAHASLADARKGADQAAIDKALDDLKRAEFDLQLSDWAYGESLRAYEAGVTHPLLIRSSK